MRFVVFDHNGDERLGVLLPDGSIVAELTESRFPRDLTKLIEQGKGALTSAGKAINGSRRFPLSDIRLRAPFPRPKRNVICVGKNYYQHSQEFHKSGFDTSSGGQEIPDAPVIFTKATTSVIGPGDAIPATGDPSESSDYEGELAVVIGAAGRNIPKERAYDHVCGYTVVNDVTARHLQQRHKQWFLGKSLDGFCPMGPVFVTADEIGDVTRLQLTTRVNGEVRQSACVGDLIFDIPTIIETLSSVLTLVPGDIIATGTPAGVGIGFDPPRFLAAGDTVSVEIDQIGVLENPVT